MRLRRMGAAFPTRLSFLRTLLRKLSAENAMVTRPVWQIDSDGFGHAVYTIRLGGYDYSLIAVSTDLPDDMRTDRVIATAWDTAYVLYDGVPDAAALARIIRDAPQQEAARFTHRELVLSRANKSVRLFDHVVTALKAGRQPDRARLNDTGYLMRTTAVYGNGKFGIADRGHFSDRPGLSGPFIAEMLTVWLIRGFTHDLVEHMGGAKLDRDIKRHLGIGNSTGLGMAPFLVNHPLLLDAWMFARETALSRVRAVKQLEIAQIERIYELVARAAEHLAKWEVADPIAARRIDRLRRDWVDFTASLTPYYMLSPMPVELILGDSMQYSVDAQELIAALVLEPFGDIVDPLADLMASPFVPTLDPRMTCDALMFLIRRDWHWACDIDFTDKRNIAQFWYVSEEKMEPRLGRRFEEPGAECETPLDIARQVKALSLDLKDASGSVAQFLGQFPQHRAAARRVQTLDTHPYAEIRENLIGEDCLPIDLLRCKLAFFGAARFDPKSDRWTRVTLAQGAPLFDELDNADDWWLPVAPS
ncbi:hypothetical protein [Yoonia sediminilitoris]|uniref:Uncharacterized protein n=1 Tax=Yoonia sediminilitoris TaxID=1286148 RepID=A0A2T6KMB3_9RHOB|nr:hypothetical protein [Yoonia sediminilitoris]PUB17362.1 hypothetical protein C8N45_102374 [Yoonia sediminilitoris]RCW97657.1 hypothetical protein DFP92_102374 [Yoonia sediminilitoris]